MWRIKTSVQFPSYSSPVRDLIAVLFHSAYPLFLSGGREKSDQSLVSALKNLRKKI